MSKAALGHPTYDDIHPKKHLDGIYRKPQRYIINGKLVDMIVKPGELISYNSTIYAVPTKNYWGTTDYPKRKLLKPHYYEVEDLT